MSRSPATRPGVAALSLPRTSGMPSSERARAAAPTRRRRRATRAARATDLADRADPVRLRVRGQRQGQEDGQRPDDERRHLAAPPVRRGAAAEDGGSARVGRGAARGGRTRRAAGGTKTGSAIAYFILHGDATTLARGGSTSRNNSARASAGVASARDATWRTMRATASRRERLARCARCLWRCWRAAGGDRVRGERVRRAPLGDDRGRAREALRHRDARQVLVAAARGGGPVARAHAAAQRQARRPRVPRPRVRHAAGQGAGRPVHPVSDEARKHIVDDIAPKLIEMMQQPPPPKPADGTPQPARPEHPLQGRRLRLLSHEPPLVDRRRRRRPTSPPRSPSGCRPTSRTASTTARSSSASSRSCASSAPPSVKTLPAHDHRGIDQERQGLPARRRHRRRRHEEARRRGPRRAGQAHRLAGVDRQAARPRQRGQHRRRTRPPRAQQVNAQLKTYQEQELEKVFTNMKRVGGRPVVDYCLAYARDKGKSEKMRTDALAAIENRIDKNIPADFQTHLRHHPRRRGTPTRVRGVAMARLGELPKDMIVAKLYALFTTRSGRSGWTLPSSSSRPSRRRTCPTSCGTCRPTRRPRWA